MARFLFRALSGHTICSTMMHAGLLQLVLVAMVIGERCTRAVPSVQEYPAKKVHVLRRVPAACSNWDKAWSWLTKVDCGTKYRLDYVTVPPREVKQYKLQYVCCDGDTNCKEADNIHTSGFNSTDEKFLAIVLGSAAACVVIIIIVFAITFYTKKTRCYGTCDQDGHVYASADGDESVDGNRENLKSQPEDVESEADQKGSEVEYAEISYPQLPRYTDIFKESADGKPDPFNRASAPPLYSAATDQSYINSENVFPQIQSASREGIRVLMTSSPISRADTDTNFDEIKPQQSAGASLNGECESDVIYYNVKEKARKKKRSSSSSQEGSTNNIKGEVRRERGQSTSGIKCQATGRKSKPSGSKSVEMMVKSSSASENIGKMSEALLKKQKRRSAPPGTVDVPMGSTHRYQASTNSASISSISCSNSNSACSIINEAVIESQWLSDSRRKTSMRENQQQNLVRKTSQSGRSSLYENSGVRPSLQGHPKSNLISHASNVADLSSTCGLISASNAVVLTCSDPASMALVPESSQPTETDALLNTLLSQSDCVNDQSFEDCENFSKYDRLKPMSPDSDKASLHLYQCLDDVKKECQELQKCSSSSNSEVSLENSDVHLQNKREIGQTNNSGSRNVVNNSKRQHRPAPC